MPLSGIPRAYPKRADGSELHPEAKRWFDLWAQSGQSEFFDDWRWQRLEMTTLLVDRYYAQPSATSLAQIRATEKTLEEAGD